MATIYAVVRVQTNLKECDEFNPVHVYTKQTSNLEVMKAYKEEIEAKYPWAKVYLVSREKAQQMKKIGHQMMEEFVDRAWKKAFKQATGKKFERWG